MCLSREPLWNPYGDNPAWQSYPNYLDLRDRNRSFEELAAFNFLWVSGLDTGKDAIRRKRLCDDGKLLRRAAAFILIGRFFHASDEHGDNSAPYIVLTYAYWHTVFRTIAASWAAPFYSTSILTPSLAWRRPGSRER
jgi:hypothetical protein